MKVKILRNLASPYPAFKEGEVRTISDNDLAAKLLSLKLAEETDEVLTEGVEKEPKPVQSAAAPGQAALQAREFDQQRAGGDLPPTPASTETPKKK